MKRILFASLALVVGAMTLTGCSEMFVSIEAGNVIAKDYSPESGYYSTICASYDANMSCTVSVPVWNEIPESWSITLEERDAAEPQSSSHSVSEEYWNEVEIGDYVDLSE